MTLSYQASTFKNADYSQLEEQQGLQRPYTELTDYPLS